MPYSLQLLHQNQEKKRVPSQSTTHEQAFGWFVHHQFVVMGSGLRYKSHPAGGARLVAIKESHSDQRANAADDGQFYFMTCNWTHLFLLVS